MDNESLKFIKNCYLFLNDINGYMVIYNIEVIFLRV